VWRLTESFREGDIFQDGEHGDNQQCRSQGRRHVKEVVGCVAYGDGHWRGLERRQTSFNISCKQSKINFAKCPRNKEMESRSWDPRRPLTKTETPIARHLDTVHAWYITLIFNLSAAKIALSTSGVLPVNQSQSGKTAKRGTGYPAKLIRFYGKISSHNERLNKEIER